MTRINGYIDFWDKSNVFVFMDRRRKKLRAYYLTTEDGDRVEGRRKAITRGDFAPWWIDINKLAVVRIQISRTTMIVIARWRYIYIYTGRSIVIDRSDRLEYSYITRHSNHQTDKNRPIVKKICSSLSQDFQLRNFVEEDKSWPLREIWLFIRIHRRERERIMDHCMQSRRVTKILPRSLTWFQPILYLLDIGLLFRNP